MDVPMMTAFLVMLLEAFKSGILTLLAAAAIDREAFLSWQKPDDIRAFDWSLALFRYAKGFAIGFVPVLLGYLYAWATA